jgi:hypothetical protein
LHPYFFYNFLGIFMIISATLFFLIVFLKLEINFKIDFYFPFSFPRPSGHLAERTNPTQQGKLAHQAACPLSLSSLPPSPSRSSVAPPARCRVMAITPPLSLFLAPWRTLNSRPLNP